jgi:hypothetical protein
LAVLKNGNVPEGCWSLIPEKLSMQDGSLHLIRARALHRWPAQYHRPPNGHETGLTIRKCTNHPCAPSDLSHDPLEWIVCSDLLPVNVREVTVGQGLVDGLLDEIGSPGLAGQIAKT